MEKQKSEISDLGQTSAVNFSNIKFCETEEEINKYLKKETDIVKKPDISQISECGGSDVIIVL